MENTTFSNFVISVRNVEGSGATAAFGSEPGETLYLNVPDKQTPHPVHHSVDQKTWVDNVIKRATRDNHPQNSKNSRSGYTIGDILVFVHGYNNSVNDVMERHDLLQKNLRANHFQGVIVSFDWPSAECALNYLEDRSDARSTAHRLVEDGIKVLAIYQRDQDNHKCDIDVHLLGHSTGAYVIREAFYEASQSRQLSRINWNVSQVVFIGGDIARISMSADNGKSKALFEHSVRITNYQNPFDSVLKLSNLKRLGLSSRIGRVGLPSDTPDTVVNINVGRHYRSLKPNRQHPSWSHSWYFEDITFSEDLVATLMGDIDRNAIPTRVQRDGSLWLASAGSSQT